jgi:hypothetical protein
MKIASAVHCDPVSVMEFTGLPPVSRLELWDTIILMAEVDTWENFRITLFIQYEASSCRTERIKLQEPKYDLAVCAVRRAECNFRGVFLLMSARKTEGA